MRSRRNVSLVLLRRVFGSVSLAGCLLLILVCARSTTAVAYAEGSFQRTLQVTGPVNLDVSTGSGSRRFLCRRHMPNQIQCRFYFIGQVDSLAVSVNVHKENPRLVPKEMIV